MAVTMSVANLSSDKVVVPILQVQLAVGQTQDVSALSTYISAIIDDVDLQNQITAGTIQFTINGNVVATQADMIRALGAGGVTLGTATPTGVVTPAFIGQIYINTTSSSGYIATGLGNTTWVAIV